MTYECKLILFPRLCRKTRMSPKAAQQVNAGFITYRLLGFVQAPSPPWPLVSLSVP